MDLNAILALEPEELVAIILERRQFLAKALPEIEGRMSSDVDHLNPLVEKVRLERDSISNKISELKKQLGDEGTEISVPLQEKLDQEMQAYVEQYESSHVEFIQKRSELRNSTRQVERSRSLIKQSESAIRFWQDGIESGFGTLLESAARVESGGASTIRRRSADLPIATKDESGGEEE